MSDLFLLSDTQLRRIEPCFPLAHGIPRVDDRRVLSGIIFVIRNGLRWRDAPEAYGPPKTLYNRFIRWSRMGVFDRIFAALARKGGKPDRIMIDATHLKAHRTAANLLKKGPFPQGIGRTKGGLNSKVAATIPLGLNVGRFDNPFSRAISSHWEVTLRSSSVTRVINVITRSRSSAGESVLKSGDGGITT